MLKLACLLAFVAGVCVLQTQPALVAPWPWLLAGSALIIAALFWPRWRWLAVMGALACGFGYADLRAHWRLADRLNPALENQAVEASGYIADLPRDIRFGTRFTFVPDGRPDLPTRIQASWYGKPPPVHVGERWQVQLKPKQVHGTLNPGGFDAESWLLQQDIGATANIRHGEKLPGFAWQTGIDRVREALRSRILSILPDAPYRGVVVALTVGDQGGIPNDQWQRYAATGVTHLISISGLHITLLAGLMAGLVRWLWRRSRYAHRLGAPRAALLAGLITALLYSLLAGMSVPTQRTLLMLAVTAWGLWKARPAGTFTIWLAALTAVLVFDPFAALSVGFWLSFLTVGGLLWAGSARLGEGLKWHGWVSTQWAATLASFPLLLIVFQQVPLVSPLANAVAIPLVSVVITPLALLGLLDPTGLALHGAERLFALTDWLLQWCERLPLNLLTLPAPPAWAWLPALLGVLLLLAPRGLAGRLPGLVLLMPLVAFKPVQPDDVTYRVTVLDVGQGLAVLVQTRQHALLYDTGPPPAGQRNVLPTLRALGAARLDVVIVSHNDNDHSGGAADVLNAVRPAQLLSSLPADHPARQLQVPHVACQQGQAWQRDGVHFAIVWPPADFHGDDNAHSCVLQVSAPGKPPLLIAGDIGAAEEGALAASGVLLPHGIVVAPHHGSAKSSTAALLDATAPRWVVFSAGYLNHFGHPKPATVARYEAAGAQALRTDAGGAIRINVGDSVTISNERATRQRYWLAAPAPAEP
ncbi:ComE operon protein 3 [Andreprevotia sp. IGB-42]|uniref:DNA internalization-related competence protein ComEC/Rec2 n=1 Tax=Andreprevotia sp. IGB-42 TaxID=2497473 RepID=UPI0013599160|nr:DNA internalization-related competence protein ComEC/Rec2 [Andreprevotia sp. IGB-42]KAF0812965.1 ComE operon protein 3 [Andreprevotia sp. IGB-42]